MTPKELIDHYGTQVKAAAALGLRQSTVSEWWRAGRVPVAQQIVIERASGGALRANLDDAFAEVRRRREGHVTPAVTEINAAS